LRGERDVPIADSAEWVLKAFEWYAQGDGTYTIGKRMRGNAPPHTWLTSRVGEDGERIEKTRAGTRWESLRVAKLLRQARYRGTIVPPELFDSVQRRLQDTPKPGSRRKREYPLSGAMRCEGCGRRLHGCARGASSSGTLADGTRKVYRREALRYYACVVCEYAVNAERVERAFFEHVGRLVADKALLRRWIAAPKSTPPDSMRARRSISQLEAEVSDEQVNRRRDHLFDLAIAASIDEVEFKRQVNRLAEEVSSKRAKLTELRAAVNAEATVARNHDRASALLSNFRTLYENATYEQKRELTSALADALGGLLISKGGLIWKASIDFGESFSQGKAPFLTRKA
jgi:ribosomal protein L34E